MPVTPSPIAAFEGRTLVSRCLQAMMQLPAVYSAAAMKLSVSSAISEMSGVSKSHIANGGLGRLKPKKQEAVRETARERGLALAQKKGWSREEYDQVQSSAPRLVNDDVASWASWIHVIQNSEHAPLPLVTALALERDEFIDFLARAFDANEPETFCGAVAELIVEEQTEHPEDANHDLLYQWGALTTWEGIAKPFADLTQFLLIDFLAALDSEWGARYFAPMEPQPVFLWVAPRLNPDWKEGQTKTRNQVYRPIRRLLEFTYAIVERAYLDTWPDAVPGRKTVAEAVGLSDYLVGNLFDGTRKLGFEEFESFWESMCRQPRLQRKRIGLASLPNVLVLVALSWNETLVRTGSGMRLKSATLLDEADYRGRWKFYRELWATQLGPIQPADKESDRWPGWLTSQTIRPSSWSS